MPVNAVIQKWGNSRALRIPKSLAQQVGLEEGSSVTLRVAKGGLFLQPTRSPKKTYKLSDLLARCPKRNPHREAITGRSGKEIF